MGKEHLVAFDMEYMRQKAHSKNLEFILGENNTVCVRPMHFNNEGIRQVRMRPDLCEFVSIKAASEFLEAYPNTMSLFDEFISGIMDATGFHRMDADTQWASYSRQLSDSERHDIERGGYSNGLAMGSEILTLV
jgi:hypothetical protein